MVFIYYGMMLAKVLYENKDIFERKIQVFEISNKKQLEPCKICRSITTSPFWFVNALLH